MHKKIEYKIILLSSFYNIFFIQNLVQKMHIVAFELNFLDVGTKKCYDIFTYSNS